MLNADLFENSPPSASIAAPPRGETEPSPRTSEAPPDLKKVTASERKATLIIVQDLGLSVQFDRDGLELGVMLEGGFAVFAALARHLEAAERGVWCRRRGSS